MRSARVDLDSPWKEILEHFLAAFFALFFPRAHGEIDWSRGVDSLDSELQGVVEEAGLGRRVVDRLFRVWLRDGQETWVLIHIEVQSQRDAHFAERMFEYSYRLRARFKRRLMSVAVLADDRARWRPGPYVEDLWGCEIRFTYPIVKLLDWRARWAELEASRNPFATVVMAHLKARETRRDPSDRARTKLALTRRLYELGYGREEIVNLFRFIDWVLRLPDDLDAEFWRTVRTEEEARRMPYITSVERIGMKKGYELGHKEGLEEGLRSGLLAGIELALTVKFGAAAHAVLPELRELTDLAVLQAVAERLKTAETLDEVRRVYLANGPAETEPPARDSSP